MASAETGALRLRIVSALILAPLALGCAWLGGWPLALLLALAAAGMAWEWARLTAQRGWIAAAIVVASVAAVGLAGFGRELAGVLVAAAGALAVGFAARRAGSADPAWAALGTAWIALASVALLWLAASPDAGRASILWLLVTVWASDTGAYAAGRGIGGPRLAPRLSPNKTWAGCAGGVLGAAATGYVAALAFGRPAALPVVLGVATGLAAQAGDLLESLAKRRFGVKDTGSLIPGHGGLLDRLDGLLAAAMFQGLLKLASGAPPITWQN